MSEGVFKFTPRVQEQILAVIWMNIESFHLYKGCVKPRYFTDAIHIDICRIIFNYWEKYNAPPSKLVLEEEISIMLEKQKSKKDLKKDYLDCIDRLAKANLSDIDYVKDKIIDFGKKQAMIEAIMQCADIIEKKPADSFTEISSIISDAQLVGTDVEDLGLDYWDDYEKRLTSYQEEEDVIERFPTGSKVLDAVLKGGLGRTEMGVVLAPPGRGKTTFMQMCAKTALKLGKNVVHISLENNEKQILRNYDLSMLHKSIEYIQENVENCAKALGYSKKYGAGNLFVKKFLTKKASVDDIRNYLNRLIVVKGVHPDMLIVDYGAILKPLHNWNDKRNTIESNYEDLRALADEYNVALWTGAQGNRASLSKKVVTMEDLAEAFAISNTSDVMIALCQTNKEKFEGILRGFLTKNRDGVGDILLKGTIEYECKTIIFEEDITEELFEDEDDDSDSKPRKKYNNKKPSEEEPDVNWNDSGRKSKRKDVS